MWAALCLTAALPPSAGAGGAGFSSPGPRARPGLPGGLITSPSFTSSDTEWSLHCPAKNEEGSRPSRPGPPSASLPALLLWAFAQLFSAV